MLKRKRIVNKSISVLLSLLIVGGMLSTTVLTVAASNANGETSTTSLDDGSPISSEEILQALQSAEIVDASQDSVFTLADSSTEITDDYFPETADASEEEALQPEQSNEIIGDEMVYYTQKWLNQEYGSVAGFGSVPGNGKTGSDTVHGLLRALQHELKIEDLSNAFGPTTSSRYSANQLHRQDGVTDKKFAILQGTLWCKGYNPGYNITERPDGTIAFNAVFDEDVEDAVKQLQSDAGLSSPNGIVSLNLMKALMSMDSFKLLPSSYGSNANIRAFQQLMNRNYEAYTGLTPCDGVYGRNTNKALVYALQAEEKLPISVANGNFGNTTQLCCPEIPYEGIAKSYSSNVYSHASMVSFTKLLQFALYVNGFGDGNFNGVFNNSTKQAVRAFQDHHAITATGKVDKGTWLSLFISCGDRNRSAISADCATILTQPKAEALYANGYRYIGRYLTGTYNGGISKALTREEAEIILATGLKFFPIYQTSGRASTYFTPEQGTADAKAAIAAASALGVPQNTIIYFAVDFDAMDYQITSNVIPYFEKVYEEISSSIYKTGIYGARNVCTRVSNKGYACSSFVGNMSTGFSGNLGFKMPSNWAFDQFTDRDQSGKYLSISSSDGAFAIDKDGFSGRDKGVSSLDNVNNSSIPEISLGPTGDTTINGPTINIFGQEYPLFKLNIGMNAKIANIESIYDKEKNQTKILIGVNAFGSSSETMGTTQKKGKYNQAYIQTKNLISKIGKNDREFTQTFNDFKGSLYQKGVKVGFDMKAYFAGYMTIDFNTGKVVESGMAFMGNAKQNIKYPIAPTIYAKFSIEGSVKAGFKLIMQDSGEIAAQGDFEFAVKPSISLGVDILVANAYAGISGKLDCKINPFSKILEDSIEISLSASAFFEYSALLWGDHFEWEFANKKLYPTETALQNLSISSNDLEFIQPIDKSVNTYSINNPDAFAENMQVYCLPKIISLGNGKMLMTYIDDASNRTASNRSILMYSVFDGTQWSSPLPILDDGTGDFQPAIYSDGNNGAYIVWQNATNTFNSNVTLSEMSENMDLYFTHWTGSSFENTTAITENNDNYEMGCKIVSSSGNISVVWQQNSQNDSFAINGTNSIHRRQYSNGAWQNTEVVASGLQAINSIDTTYISENNVVAYSTKTTTDTSTTDDLEVFYFDGENTTRVTNDNVPDYSVNFCGNDLYWIGDNSVISASTVNFETKTTVIPDLGSNVSQIKTVKNLNGQKAIVWAQEDEAGIEVYGSYFNSETNTFGTPKPLCTNVGVIRGWDACMLPNGKIELSYCAAEKLEEPVNNKQYGQIDLIQKSADDFYDISVDPIATHSEEISANNDITLITEVYNNGSLPISQFSVNIIGANDSIIQTSTINQNLAIGETGEIEIPFTLPNSINRTDYKIQIQPVGGSDISSSDNEAIFSFGFADLAVEAVEEIRTTSARQLKVTVKNKGFDSIETASLQLLAGSYDGTVIGTADVQSLLPGTTSSYTFNLDESYSNSSISEDPRLIYIVLTSTDEESDYENNSYQYNVYPDYLINVSAGTTGGTVTGGGTFIKDSEVEITATANSGYVFRGWYENDVKIFDAEETYTFTATSCRTLEARFIALDFCNITAVPTKTGVVDETNKYLRGMAKNSSVSNYFTATDGGSICLIANNQGCINATGTQAELLSASGTVIDTYTIVILGDVNGDSVVDAFDTARMDLHLNSHPLTGAYLEAADVNQDGIVDITDYQIIRNMSLGL